MEATHLDVDDLPRHPLRLLESSYSLSCVVLVVVWIETLSRYVALAMRRQRAWKSELK